MAIRVLEAIGLRISKSQSAYSERFEDLPKEVQEGIEIGWRQLRAGQSVSNEEVFRKAKMICNE